MLLKQIPIKKIIAAILPFCFLWVFAACILTCVDDCAEIVQHSSVSSEISDASDSDFCSIVNTPVATTYERTAFDFQISFVVLHQVFPVNSIKFAPAKILRRDGKTPFREPPLKLLSVLRI